ncbi:MAG TPA: hypothetical protein VJN01_03275, partial [Xanthomonadales bacterium]|nr:hypothetical protein [Xanthomonadales bacterium]
MKLNTLMSLSLLSLAAITFSITFNLSAAEAESTDTRKKVVVALKTDDVELHEMDISHLQPGDAETIITEDGKTIDLLRTEDDVEIYVDGKLLELGAEGVGHHKVVHARHKEMGIDCDAAADCEELEWLS